MNYYRSKSYLFVIILCIIALGVYYTIVQEPQIQTELSSKSKEIIDFDTQFVDSTPVKRDLLEKLRVDTSTEHGNDSGSETDDALAASVDPPMLIPEDLHMSGMKCLPDPKSFRMHMDFATLWKKAEWYAEFHREGVANINRGRSDLVKTLIWYCPDRSCGGLGYRFRGIIFNLFIAMFTNRVLILDWQDVSAEVQYLLPNKIDWRWKHLPLIGRKEAIGNFVKSRKSFPGKFMSLVRDPKIQHLKAHYNAHLKFSSALMSKDPSILSSFHNNLYKALISHKPVIDAFAMNYLFKFTNELLKYSNQVRQNIGYLSYVALHLRTGQFDDLKISDSSHRFDSGVKQWREALNCAIHQAVTTIGPQGVVLVVSDSYKAKIWARNTYGDKVKILNSTIVHVDKSSDLRESDEGMLGIWQDLITMGEASTLVMKASTFPELAMALCALTPNRVIDYTTCDPFEQT